MGSKKRLIRNKWEQCVVPFLRYEIENKRKILIFSNDLIHFYVLLVDNVFWGFF
jgi:hypothetical protein